MFDIKTVPTWITPHEEKTAWISTAVCKYGGRLLTLTKFVRDILSHLNSESSYRKCRNECQRNVEFYKQLSQGLDWNIAWYILFSFSLLFSSSVSHSASQRATSLFFPETPNSQEDLNTEFYFSPPDIEATFMKLVLARSKSFSLMQAWPRLYQAFSLLLSSSITIWEDSH